MFSTLCNKCDFITNQGKNIIILNVNISNYCIISLEIQNWHQIILLLNFNSLLFAMKVDQLASNEKLIIGEGSFGKVYKYKYNNEFYAIKKILKDAKHHTQLIDKIQAEGKVMNKAANHRNIVGYMGQTTFGKHLYLLTEYMPDGDLRRVNFLPSENDLWQIVMQMAMALNHLKRNKIIHRDIKLQNILMKINKQIDRQQQIVLKLTDFGLAQEMENINQIKGIAGSPVYLAPQMCKYQYYSYEIDIWSLGITLYQLTHDQKSPYHEQILQFMSINKYKHTEKSLVNYLMTLIQSKIIKCSSPYPHVNQLIQSMLTHNPKTRPTPIQILKHPKVVQKVIRYSQNIKNNLFQNNTLSMKKFKNDNQQQPKISNPNQHNKNQLLVYSQSLQFFLSSRISNSLLDSIKKDSKLAFDNKSYELLSLELIPSVI